MNWTPELIIILVAWVASTIVAIWRKDAEVLWLPLILTVLLFVCK